MVWHDPAGEEHPPLAFVFGDAIGRRVSDPKKQWYTAVLKAHGHEPQWVANKKLGPVSREALRLLDLHFHDLRMRPAHACSKLAGPCTTFKRCSGTRI